MRRVETIGRLGRGARAGQFGLGAAIAMIWLSPNAAADADSLNDFFGPREISVGESMRADATGARATTLNPAGLGLNSQLVFQGAYGFRPDDSATAIAASACDSTVPVPGCFYYNYFDAEPEVDGRGRTGECISWG